MLLHVPDAALYATAAPAAAAAAAPAAGEEAAAAAPAEEKKFDVLITGYEAKNKIKVIKEVRTFKKDLNLIESKNFCEALPAALGEGLSKDEAEAMKAALEKIGAQVDLK